MPFRQIPQSLKFGEMRFGDIADAWAMPLMILDRELCFVYANEAYLSSTETAWQDIKGRYIFDVFPDEQGRQAPVEALFRKVFEGQQTMLEAQPYDLKMPDGRIETRIWQAVQDPFRNEQGEITHMIQRAEDITAQVELKRQNEVMENELAHRIRNMFAVIMATSRISGDSAEDVGTFVNDFNERLGSMSRVYASLTRNKWKGLYLRNVIKDELDAMMPRNGSSYELKGEDVLLTVKASKDAAMIVHELAANARKFGCLKTPHGKLTVEWFLDGNLLTTIWTESGGENIQPPVRSGFGTQLFHMFPKVTVDRDFREDGITVRIQVPLQEEPEGADFS